jgi:DNA-binding CsgD family transcriptional regulator
MGLAALALAQLWRTPLGDIPTTDPARGRWPTGRRAESLDLEPTAWPLFDGYVSRVMGDTSGAIRRLREALVQQSGGEGLFRSEAAAWLALSLAEADRVDEAAAVLGREPPDDVAIVPGLAPWARAGLAAARGQRSVAAAEMSEAVRAAHDAGCWLVELGYLSYLATEILDGAGAELVVLAGQIAEAIAHVDAPRLVASGEATLAIIWPSGPALLEHAKRLRSFGLGPASVRLADAAHKIDSEDPAVRAEASLLAASLRDELGLDTPEDPAVALTPREAEIAALARGGMSDREIADHLVLSIRTVETHLARVYRKLGIASRRELGAG